VSEHSPRCFIYPRPTGAKTPDVRTPTSALEIPHSASLFKDDRSAACGASQRIFVAPSQWQLNVVAVPQASRGAVASGVVSLLASTLVRPTWGGRFSPSIIPFSPPTGEKPECLPEASAPSLGLMPARRLNPLVSIPNGLGAFPPPTSTAVKVSATPNITFNLPPCLIYRSRIPPKARRSPAFGSSPTAFRGNRIPRRGAATRAISSAVDGVPSRPPERIFFFYPSFLLGHGTAGAGTYGRG